MTIADSAQSFGSEPSGPARTGGTPSVPPIPPPASVSGAQGPPGYAPGQGGGAALPSRSRRGTTHPQRVLAAGAVIAAVVIVLLVAGVFKSGSTTTKVITIPPAPASATSLAQAQAGLKEPGTLSVPGQAPFVLHFPAGWTQLTAAQLARISNVPAAGLVAEGGKALLLVRPKKPLTETLATLSSQLTKSLSSHFQDFKLLSTGTTRTLGGPAWVYTFERSKQGLVQTEVVISTSKAAYEIDIALHSGVKRAGGQISEIVHSFQT
jgi:hypothetical protein